MDNPDSIIAKKIVTTLREKKLLTEDRLKGLEQKLVSGAVEAEDWRLLAELGDKSPDEERSDDGEN